ncbi:unnamed protein product [Darwinula stevensoni]|uniref:C2H2-type domain-containing protein n=1 Tax=Darwinula stevensoni TaxID=69355 RepID=A0A7R9A1G2_9CRUS|nr:unnamed protein product [Darwinula stevensoni]CAG0883404.1 unnamed protein product [Darwinula stevensoni]
MEDTSALEIINSLPDLVLAKMDEGELEDEDDVEGEDEEEQHEKINGGGSKVANIVQLVLDQSRAVNQMLQMAKVGPGPSLEDQEKSKEEEMGKKKRKKKKANKSMVALLQNPNPGRTYNFVWNEKHIVNENGTRMFCCDICGGKYQRAFSLKRHYLKTHINFNYLSERDVVNCGISVMRKCKSTRPDLSSSDTGMKNLFTCHLCGDGFDEAKALSNHLGRHGENPSSCDKERRFSCDLCGLRFIHKHNLKRHLKKLHHQQDLFSCPVCERTFLSKQRLHSHEVIHYISRYSCAECKTVFSKQEELQAHISAGECNHGSSSTQHMSPLTTKTTAMAPSSSHGALPLSNGTNSTFAYSCAVCGQNFTDYVAMCKHRRQAHGMSKTKPSPNAGSGSRPLMPKPQHKQPVPVFPNREITISIKDPKELHEKQREERVHSPPDVILVPSAVRPTIAITTPHSTTTGVGMGTMWRLPKELSILPAVSVVPIPAVPPSPSSVEHPLNRLQLLVAGQGRESIMPPPPPAHVHVRPVPTPRPQFLLHPPRPPAGVRLPMVQLPSPKKKVLPPSATMKLKSAQSKKGRKESQGMTESPSIFSWAQYNFPPEYHENEDRNQGNLPPKTAYVLVGQNESLRTDSHNVSDLSQYDLSTQALLSNINRGTRPRKDDEAEVDPFLQCLGLYRKTSGSQDNGGIQMAEAKDSPFSSVVEMRYLCQTCGYQDWEEVAVANHAKTEHPGVLAKVSVFEGCQEIPIEMTEIARSTANGLLTTSVVPPSVKDGQQLVCTKCSSVSYTLGDLHRHLLECGGLQWEGVKRKKRRKEKRGRVARLVGTSSSSPTSSSTSSTTTETSNLMASMKSSPRLTRQAHFSAGESEVEGIAKCLLAEHSQEEYPTFANSSMNSAGTIMGLKKHLPKKRPAPVPHKTAVCKPTPEEPKDTDNSESHSFKGIKVIIRGGKVIQQGDSFDREEVQENKEVMEPSTKKVKLHKNKKKKRKYREQTQEVNKAVMEKELAPIQEHEVRDVVKEAPEVKEPVKKKGRIKQKFDSGISPTSTLPPKQVSPATVSGGFACQSCAEIFTNKSAAERHMKKCPLKPAAALPPSRIQEKSCKPVPNLHSRSCPHCHKTFTYLTVLSKHVLLCQANPKKKVKEPSKALLPQLRAQGMKRRRKKKSRLVHIKKKKLVNRQEENEKPEPGNFGKEEDVKYSEVAVQVDEDKEMKDECRVEENAEEGEKGSEEEENAEKEDEEKDEEKEEEKEEIEESKEVEEESEEKEEEKEEVKVVEKEEKEIEVEEKMRMKNEKETEKQQQENMQEEEAADTEILGLAEHIEGKEVDLNEGKDTEGEVAGDELTEEGDVVDINDYENVNSTCSCGRSFRAQATLSKHKEMCAMEKALSLSQAESVKVEDFDEICIHKDRDGDDDDDDNEDSMLRRPGDHKCTICSVAFPSLMKFWVHRLCHLLLDRTSSDDWDLILTYVCVENFKLQQIVRRLLEYVEDLAEDENIPLSILESFRLHVHRHLTAQEVKENFHMLKTVYVQNKAKGTPGRSKTGLSKADPERISCSTPEVYPSSPVTPQTSVAEANQDVPSMYVQDETPSRYYAESEASFSYEGEQESTDSSPIPGGAIYESVNVLFDQDFKPTGSSSDGFGLGMLGGESMKALQEAMGISDEQMALLQSLGMPENYEKTTVSTTEGDDETGNDQPVILDLDEPSASTTSTLSTPESAEPDGESEERGRRSSTSTPGPTTQCQICNTECLNATMLNFHILKYHMEKPLTGGALGKKDGSAATVTVTSSTATSTSVTASGLRERMTMVLGGLLDKALSKANIKKEFSGKDNNLLKMVANEVCQRIQKEKEAIWSRRTSTPSKEDLHALEGEVSMPYNKRPFQCILCRDRFTKVDTLRIHLKLAHSLTPEFIDQALSRQLKNVTEEKKRMRDEEREREKEKENEGGSTGTGQEDGQSQSQTKCRVCGQAFDDVRDLRRHYGQNHKGHSVIRNEDIYGLMANKRSKFLNGPFQCPICNEHYAHSGSLWRHINNRHSEWKVENFMKEGTPGIKLAKTSPDGHIITLECSLKAPKKRRDPVTKEWVELEPEVKHEESTSVSPEADDSTNNTSHSCPEGGADSPVVEEVQSHSEEILTPTLTSADLHQPSSSSSSEAWPVPAKRTYSRSSPLMMSPDKEKDLAFKQLANMATGKKEVVPRGNSTTLIVENAPKKKGVKNEPLAAPSAQAESVVSGSSDSGRSTCDNLYNRVCSNIMRKRGAKAKGDD